MNERRRLITAIGAGLLLSAGRTARADSAAALCAPADCISCGPTGRATAGPFYVSNAPAVMEINLLRMPGTPMSVGGIVLGGPEGRTPLPGAQVELWHADAAGRYHPEDNGDITRYRADEINLRGLVRCDDAGRFVFTSIVPGHYGHRRRHLHWRVVADGHRPLVTQTYWKDELGSARERSDGVDRNPEACRWIDFQAADGGSRGQVVFVLNTVV